MQFKIKTLITKEELSERVQELATQITNEYKGKTLHLICVLKGSVIFMCDFAKALGSEVDVTLDFMAVSSYGNAKVSSGIVKIVKDLDEAIENKDVLIIEDIIDSGRTLQYLLQILKERKPNSIKICTLLDKPKSRVVNVKVDYVGYEIPDYFVVGYGLDYQQKYRNLPYIGYIENDDFI